MLLWHQLQCLHVVHRWYDLGGPSAKVPACCVSQLAMLAVVAVVALMACYVGARHLWPPPQL